MKLQLYLPKKLNNLQDFNDVIFDPLFLIDWYILKWFKTSIQSYFDSPVIKIFAGEKPFQPAIEKPPIFVIQPSTTFSINDDTPQNWMGSLQLLPHRMRFSFDGTSENIEDTYARLIPIKASYQIDGYFTTKRDMNKYNLWYIDIFSQIGFVYQNMDGIRLENQGTGGFDEMKYYLNRGATGFTTTWAIDGTDTGDVIHNAVASVDFEGLLFRDMGDFPTAKKLILHYFLTNFDLDDIYFYDAEENGYLNVEDTEKWKDNLIEELKSQGEYPDTLPE